MICIAFFKKIGQTRPLFIFDHFSLCKDKYVTNLTINEKSIDGMLNSQTWGGRMEGADESTELWRHPNLYCYLTMLVLMGGVITDHLPSLSNTLELATFMLCLLHWNIVLNGPLPGSFSLFSSFQYSLQFLNVAYIILSRIVMFTLNWIVFH